jgi:hypothetical protein
MLRSAVIATVLLPTVIGCGFEPAGPLAAEYRLESIDGDPLPAVSISNSSVTIEILESRLEFKSTTRGEQHERLRSTSAGDSDGTVFETESPFSYRLVGDRLEITFDCDDTGSCIAGPHLVGEVGEDKIEFDQALGRTPLLYRPNAGS